MAWGAVLMGPGSWLLGWTEQVTISAVLFDWPSPPFAYRRQHVPDITEITDAAIPSQVARLVCGNRDPHVSAGKLQSPAALQRVVDLWWTSQIAMSTKGACVTSER